MSRLLACLSIALVLSVSACSLAAETKVPSTRAFRDGAQHWYNITGADKLIAPERDRPTHRDSDVTAIAENLLVFQNPDGGWPKNLDMCAKLTEEQSATAAENRGLLPSTFDNGATHSQLRYLAAAQAITDREEFREAFLRGLKFVLDSQYENGGWPQIPGSEGYQRHVTFNDNSMVGVMQMLQAMAAKRPEYNFVPEGLHTQAVEAYQRGLECILACQIEVNGRKTAWCQQHHDQTLEPVGARRFEKPSISGSESAGIVNLLMREPNRTPEIAAAVEAAVAWFHEVELHGIRVERRRIEPVRFTYHTARSDKVVVQDPEAPVLWARFYEIETFRPLFCGRDGKVKYSLAEIDQDRRTGYAWYVRSPESVYRVYDNWKQRGTPAKSP